MTAPETTLLTPWTTEPGSPATPPAATAPESVVTIERAPRPWSLGAGASVGATIRLDTDVSPSLGVAARLDNELVGLGLRVTWLAPSTVTGVDAAPTVGETTSVLSLVWLPGDALLAAEGGASFLSVWDATGDARGDLVVAPLVGARAGWRIRPGAGWAVEPFVGAEYLARKVSLLTVAEGKTTLTPVRLRAGVTAYFSPGES